MLTNNMFISCLQACITQQHLLLSRRYERTLGGRGRVQLVRQKFKIFLLVIFDTIGNESHVKGGSI